MFHEFLSRLKFRHVCDFLRVHGMFLYLSFELRVAKWNEAQ